CRWAARHLQGLLAAATPGVAGEGAGAQAEQGQAGGLGNARRRTLARIDVNVVEPQVTGIVAEPEGQRRGRRRRLNGEGVDDVTARRGDVRLVQERRGAEHGLELVGEQAVAVEGELDVV